MRLRSRIPGVLLVVAVAAVAWAISRLLPSIPAAPVALLLGLMVALPGERLPTGPGVVWSATRMLRLGVTLLGAQLSLGVIMERGADAAPLIILVLGFVFVVAVVGGRVLGLESPTRLLIATGIGICGNSAIAAASPLVRATQQQVATAVAMITVFGTVAVFVCPVVGARLDLSPSDYGLWTGVAIADTAQVVAAGFAGGPDAGEVATITKLTRNAFLGPVVLLVAYLAARSGNREGPGVPLSVAIPPFVVGFLVLAGLRSVGIIGASLGDVVAAVGGFAILVGLAGIGYGLRRTRPRRADARALAFGFGIMLAVAIGSLTVVIVT